MIDLDKRPAGNEAAWAEIDRLRTTVSEMSEVLAAIIVGLDVPRNRFGKIDGDLATSNPLSNLAVKYKLPHGGQDIADAAVMVARAVLSKAGTLS